MRGWYTKTRRHGAVATGPSWGTSTGVEFPQAMGGVSRVRVGVPRVEPNHPGEPRGSDESAYLQVIGQLQLDLEGHSP